MNRYLVTYQNKNGTHHVTVRGNDRKHAIKKLKTLYSVDKIKSVVKIKIKALP